MSFYPVHRYKKISNQIKKIHKKISLPEKMKKSRKRFLSPMRTRNVSDKGTAFRISRKGSLTIEAAWSLPLFFLCITALTGLMELYGAYAETVVRLQEEVERLGMYAAAGDEQEERYVERIGFAEYRPFWLPFQAPAAGAICRGRVRVWTGRSGETDGGSGMAGTEETLVYVTEYGDVYHTTSRCSHLSLAIRQVAAGSVHGLRNSGGGRYAPCEKCVGSGEVYPYLYITEQGDRYHNSLECGGLKRTVHLEELSGVSGLECCSRCSQLEGGV